MKLITIYFIIAYYACGIVAQFSSILYTADVDSLGRAAITSLLAETLNCTEKDIQWNETLAKTYAQYYLRDLVVKRSSIVASECRINMNSKYRSILTPMAKETLWTTIHHNMNDALQVKLEQSIMGIFSKTKALSEFEFYNFASLLNPIECLLSFGEFGQMLVNLEQVEARIEQVLMVPQGTTSNKDEEYVQTFHTEFEIRIPLNGTYECKFGKTNTCTRQRAISTGARYKWIEY